MDLIVSGEESPAVIRIWDIDTGHELKSDDYYATVHGLSHGSTGELASFTNFTSSRWFLWDKEHWSPIQQFDKTIEGQSTTSTAFSPDETSVLVAHTDGTVRMWDLSRQGVVKQWNRDNQPVNGVDVSPDGDHLASAYNDGQVVIWDLDTGQELKTYTDIPAGAWDVDYSPDGKFLGIVSADFGGGTGHQGLIVMDLENEMDYLRLDTAPHLFEPDPDSEEGNYYVYRLKFSPDDKSILTGSILASGCCDVYSSLILWDAVTGEMIHLLEEKVGDYLALEYTSDSQKAVALEGFQNRIKVFNLQTGVKLSEFVGGEHGDAIFSIALTPDEKRILTAAGDGTMFLRDLETGEVLQSFTGSQGGIMDIEISPDGEQAVSVSFEGELLLWDVDTGNPLRRFQEHDGVVMDVEFSLDGQYAFSAGNDGQIIQWQVAQQPLEEVVEWVENNRIFRDLTPEECQQFDLLYLCEGSAAETQEGDQS